MPEDEFYRDLEATWQEHYSKARLNIMVLGPDTNRNRSSAKLRKFIIENCGAHGDVIKTEHEKMIKMHEKLTGAGHNLCSMEYDVADKIDAIIMIPDSAGALVEMGMFALDEGICSRTLLLFSVEYLQRGETSFIKLGPRLSYDQRGAKIADVDYTQMDSIWQKVEEFLQIFRARKYDKKRRSAR